MSRYYASYKSLFRVKFKVYAIGDKPLPRPIPLDLVLVYLVMSPISILLAHPLASLFDTSPVLLGLALNVGVTWGVGRFDPQGRSLPTFAADLARFVFRNRWYDFAATPVKVKKRISTQWECTRLE